MSTAPLDARLKRARIFLHAICACAGESATADGDTEYQHVIAGILEPIAALQDQLTAAQDEVTYWRQDAAARLEIAMTLAKAADAKGEDQRAAEIRVGIIFPTRAALTGALSGRIYWPLCEGCSKPVEAGDAVYAIGDHEDDGATGEVHVDCDQPALADPLPAEAHRHAGDSEFTPEGIARTLAAAWAMDRED